MEDTRHYFLAKNQKSIMLINIYLSIKMAIFYIDYKNL